MTDLRGVRFHCAMTPYEPGDVAGFDLKQAQDLVDRGIAAFHPPVADDPDPTVAALLAGMDRAHLIALGREHLGTTDDPPADVSDDDLRAAIAASVDAEILKAIAPHGSPAQPSGPPVAGKAAKPKP